MLRKHSDFVYLFILFYLLELGHLSKLTNMIIGSNQSSEIIPAGCYLNGSRLYTLKVQYCLFLVIVCFGLSTYLVLPFRTWKHVTTDLYGFRFQSIEWNYSSRLLFEWFLVVCTKYSMLFISRYIVLPLRHSDGAFLFVLCYPSELGNLAKLTYLFFNSNHLNGTIPSG